MLDNQSCFVCLIRSVMNDIHHKSVSGTNRSVSIGTASALEIAQRISNSSTSLILGNQQDPAEFLTILLDKLMQCLSSSASKCFSGYLSNSIHLLIGANMKSSVRCERCSTDRENETYESVWSISIASHSNLTLALTAFCAEERLFGPNSVECDKCQRKIAARRRLKPKNMAPIVFIHLKRFVYDSITGTTVKLKHSVTYPESIDMTSYMEQMNDGQENQNGTNEREMYRLKSVVVHLGDTADNGHIFAYVLAPDHNWYKADDENLSRVPLNAVLNEWNSYLLCYCKTRISHATICASEENRPSFTLQSSTPTVSGKRRISSIDECSPVCNNQSITLCKHRNSSV